MNASAATLSAIAPSMASARRSGPAATRTARARAAAAAMKTPHPWVYISAASAPRRVRWAEAQAPRVGPGGARGGGGGGGGGRHEDSPPVGVHQRGERARDEPAEPVPLVDEREHKGARQQQREERHQRVHARLLRVRGQQRVQPAQDGARPSRARPEQSAAQPEPERN